MSSEFIEKNYSIKMNKSIQSLKKDISTLRTGRANSSMLDTIKVDVYGQLMPIEQLATVSVPPLRRAHRQPSQKKKESASTRVDRESRVGASRSLLELRRGREAKHDRRTGRHDGRRRGRARRGVPCVRRRRTTTRNGSFSRNTNGPNGRRRGSIGSIDRIGPPPGRRSGFWRRSSGRTSGRCSRRA